MNWYASGVKTTYNQFWDSANLEFSHEHLFFEDGKTPDNTGFSPGGEFNSANIKDYQYKESIKYNDCLMRQALNNVRERYKDPKMGYKLIGNNCQNFAQQLRLEYLNLARNTANVKRCGIR